MSGERRRGWAAKRKTSVRRLKVQALATRQHGGPSADGESVPQRGAPFGAPGAEGKSWSLLLLSDLPAGAHAVVRSLSGRGGFSARVAALGVTPGADVTVMQNYHQGPMLIAVRDTAVAIGRGEALKIKVERAAAEAGE